MKRITYIAIVLTVCSIAFFSSCVSSNQLREGWVNTKTLKKKGYTIHNSFKGWIHVVETRDSLKSNIFKIKTL